jgi:hypothetical protein
MKPSQTTAKKPAIRLFHRFMLDHIKYDTPREKLFEEKV